MDFLLFPDYDIEWHDVQWTLVMDHIFQYINAP